MTGTDRTSSVDKKSDLGGSVPARDRIEGRCLAHPTDSGLPGRIDLMSIHLLEVVLSLNGTPGMAKLHPQGIVVICAGM